MHNIHLIPRRESNETTWDDNKEEIHLVVIKMDMPECCYDCPMVYDNMYCCVPGGPYFWEERRANEYPDFDFSTQRHPNCPLINLDHYIKEDHQ